MAVYFESVKTKQRYKLVEIVTMTEDGKPKDIKLQGPHTVFPMVYDVEQFKRWGYVLRREPDPVPA